jgi:hypothetical protein
VSPLPGRKGTRRPVHSTHLTSSVRIRSTDRSVGAWIYVRSIEMNTMHEQLARQRCHDAHSEARQARLVRAFRADRRARRAERSARAASEVARRAADRVVLA